MLMWVHVVSVYVTTGLKQHAGLFLSNLKMHECVSSLTRYGKFHAAAATRGREEDGERERGTMERERKVRAWSDQVERACVRRRIHTDGLYLSSPGLSVSVSVTDFQKGVCVCGGGCVRA